LIVDSQYTLPFARQVASYAKALKKPLTRLYITHYHPDHLLGAAEFVAPLYTLQSVADKIAKAGDRVAREERQKVGDEIPSTARRADRHVAEGEELLDGVRLEHRRIRSAETEDALVVGFPDARVIIVQDLVYDRSHLFLGERAFEGWRTALREYRDLPYDIILPGHGIPGGKALYDAMITYLDFAERSLTESTTSAEFRQRLLERFPDYGCRKVLEHQMRFLFPPTEERRHA
jgi:glyoxylase-like metal-dependent hydrolase (beta-lactamase superfamily II)